MVHPESQDLGCRVLRQPTCSETAIDIVAIHGKGANPAHTWTQWVDSPGDENTKKHINWLDDAQMLPKEFPMARIIRFGYASDSYGDNAIDARAANIARGLLDDLLGLREQCGKRPLVFIAHSFGGLVLVKILLLASDPGSTHHSIYTSTVGLVFLGTPFRGTSELYHSEFLYQIDLLFEQEEVMHEAYRTSNKTDHWLRDLRDDFCTKVQTLTARIACFYETIPTDLGKLLRNKKGFEYIKGKYRVLHVDENSACLDPVTDRIEKHERHCDHFKLNKFSDPNHPDWKTLVRTLERMRIKLPDTTHKIQFSLNDFPCSDYFVPRNKESSQLESFFRPSHGLTRRSVFVVYGHGGMGKTQLCAHFARDQQERFSSIFWLNGSSRDALRQSLAGKASQLPSDQRPNLSSDLPASVKQQEEIDAVQRWLSIPSNVDWLLVFDNVDLDFQAETKDSQAYNYRDFLPPVDHGNVLVTSRLTTLRIPDASIHLQQVDREFGGRILEMRIGSVDPDDAGRLTEKLGGMPLALAQAGAYMKQTQLSVFKYIQCYDNTWTRLMSSQHNFPLLEYERSIVTTFKISYDLVKGEDQNAAKLLDLWAFLDPGDVWGELLSFSHKTPKESNTPVWPYNLANVWRKLLSFSQNASKYSNTPVWLKDLAKDELLLRNSIGTLTKFSLVTAAESQLRLTIHPIVHAWCLHNLESDDAKHQLYSHALSIVAEAIQAIKNTDSKGTAQRLISHARTLSDRTQFSSNNQDIGHTSHRIAYFLSEWETSIETEKLYLQALQRKERALGPDNMSTLNTVNNLGAIYRGQGRLADAEKMYQRALQGRERALGPDHMSTLETVNNLGNLYADQGKLIDAEEMHQRALQGKERALGPSHTSTLGTVNNLGNLYLDKGRLVDADMMFQRALQGRERALGPNHTSTLDTVNNLGVLYVDQGRLTDAEEMYQRALQGKERALGPNHTSTLNTVNNLGVLYAIQGKLADAETLYQRVLPHRQSLPPLLQSRVDTLRQIIDSEARNQAP